MIFSSNSKMTTQKTINSSVVTYDKLLELSKNISLSETVALLMHCCLQSDLDKILKTTKTNRKFKELVGEGTTTFKVNEQVWQRLNQIRKDKSISIILDTIIKIYDKKQFEAYKKIKELGRL